MVPPTLCKTLAVVFFVALEHLVLDELDDFAQGEGLLAGPAHEHVIVTVRRIRCLRICCEEGQEINHGLVGIQL